MMSMLGNAGAGSSLTATVDESSELKASDLESIALLYDQIRLIHRKLQSSVDKRLAEDFDSHLKQVMQDLSTNLQEIQHITSQQEINQMSEGQK
jgi:hypothetical protein